MVTTGGKSRFSPQSSLRCNSTENNRVEQCFVTTFPCSSHMNERQRNSAPAYFPICKVKGETGLGEVTMVGRLWVSWKGGQRSEDGSCVFPGGVSKRNQHRWRGWDATRWPLLEQKSERGQWQEKNSSYLMFSPWKTIYAKRTRLLNIAVPRTPGYVKQFWCSYSLMSRHLLARLLNYDHIVQ